VRDASVGALTNCRVLLLERSALEPDAEPHLGRQRFAAALEATPEWTELRHSVIVGMLDAIPFFSALVASRRAVLATLMEVVSVGVGETIFSEGDATGLSFYIVSEGAVQIHQNTGRDLVGNLRTRILANIDHRAARPWFGELALWVNRPRQATAVVTDPIRMLVVDQIHFEAFLALVPDFRAYLNKSKAQADWFDKQAKGHGRILGEFEESGVTAEQGTREEHNAQIQTAVSMRWQSGSKLGTGSVLHDSSEGPEVGRALFAERWERLVSHLLFAMSAETSSFVAFCSTVSLKTEDYRQANKAEAPDAQPARVQPADSPRRRGAESASAPGKATK